MILISGFKPFKNEKINPSELLVTQLNLDEVQTVILPVEFDRAFVELKTKILEVNPKYILMLGQAGGRPNICLEKIALNWNQTSSADESGFTPSTGKIFNQDELALMTKFPMDALNEKLKSLKLSVELSFSAGTFVCNNVYYKVLREFPSISSLFIHVPFLPEQGDVQHPKMSLEQMKIILDQVINFVRSIESIF